jgi:hypothetical protein
MDRSRFATLLATKDVVSFVAAIHGAADALSVGEIACAKGCMHCCHLRVTATAPEVLVLAGAIVAAGAGGRVHAAVKAARAETEGLGDAERAALRWPCPLLDMEDGTCGFYRARPLTCRLHVSTDAGACAALAAGLAADPAPPTSVLDLHALLLRAQLDVLAEAGFPAETYELNAALDCALATPDAAAAWLAGDAIFKTAQKGAPSEVLAALHDTD